MKYPGTLPDRLLITSLAVADIMHPYGMPDRVGSYIYFTEDGIDSSDALGSNRRWYALEDLQYYNADGDDYFVYVDGVYDIGFKFVSEDNQIIVFTPSSNYPSSDPYNWNSRIRFDCLCYANRSAH